MTILANYYLSFLSLIIAGVLQLELQHRYVYNQIILTLLCGQNPQVRVQVSVQQNGIFFLQQEWIKIHTQLGYI